jgi:hypothetical protein
MNEYEWSIWIEKFWDKERRSGIKDILLGKVNEEINEKYDEWKSKLKITNLNELAYKELFLLIDVR